MGAIVYNGPLVDNTKCLHCDTHLSKTHKADVPHNFFLFFLCQLPEHQAHSRGSIKQTSRL